MADTPVPVSENLKRINAALALRETACTEREVIVTRREHHVSQLRNELAKSRTEVRAATDELHAEAERLKAARNENGILRGQILDLHRALRTLGQLEKPTVSDILAKKEPA